MALLKALRRKAAAGMLCAAVLTALCGCQKAAVIAGASGMQNESAGGGIGGQMISFANSLKAGEEPYTIRAVLKEYTVLDRAAGTGAYGRYTELVPEGEVPDTVRDALAECNKRAEESVRVRVDQDRETGRKNSSGTGYQYMTYGYITTVTRADSTAFSILETEFEKKGQNSSSSDIDYRFRGTAWDTKSGEEIGLTDILGDEAVPEEMLEEALSVQYGVKGLVGTKPQDYAWTADALGIRFYFNSDAVSEDRRREIGDYSARAVTAAFPYTALSGKKAAAYASAPKSYIARLDRETEYSLPHGDMSVILTKKDDAWVIRIKKDRKAPEDLIIEYTDDLSDFYIIRAQDGFYLFRERIGYQEGFSYDFARPDGGFGRFAYNTQQYFDSFLREIYLALPYNPNCAQLSEARRSFGERTYGAGSFIPYGYYSFPSDPSSRYKRFILLDSTLKIDTNNTACRLLESFDAVKIDADGNEQGEYQVPAGSYLMFEAVAGEAPRYDDPPRRSQHRDFYYECRLTDGTRIRFVSSTESTVSSEKGFFNRFTEVVSLGEALYTSEADPGGQEVFTVRIGGKDYPLIPDYSLPSHTGEEIDFGDDIWWLVEEYPGRYVSTDEDKEEMQDSWFTQEALAHPDESAELVISEDGQVVFDFFGEVYRGTLSERRFYRERVAIYMESEREHRSFQIILREGEDHSAPTRIEFYSEGLPATNEPSTQPPISVYLTRTDP